MAEALGSSRYRYENGQSKTPIELLCRYADYSDVSLDYVFTWSVKSQCMTYEFKPKATLERENALLY